MTIEIGDKVLWPNGVEGVVQATDNNGAELLDECGAWHDATECDLIVRTVGKFA
jgi:hypothetical protein